MPMGSFSVTREKNRLVQIWPAKRLQLVGWTEHWLMGESISQPLSKLVGLGKEGSKAQNLRFQGSKGCQNIPLAGFRNKHQLGGGTILGKG